MAEEEMPWYAVMRDQDDDDWGTGSHSLEKSVEMLKEYGKDAYIALIKNGVCEEEYHPRYWLETDLGYGDYAFGKADRMWGLHRVINDTDEVIISERYDSTPGFEGDKEQEPLDTSWKALDDYIKSELGFLPDYEVN